MDNKEGLATASLIIGIIGIVLSFFLGVIVIPLIIIGVVIGIVNVATGGKKYAGIILNSIAFIFNIIWSFILMFLLVFIFAINVNKDSINKFIEYVNEEKVSTTSILGDWDCHMNSDDSYIVFVSFNANNSFKWSKYNELDYNYVKGEYSYNDNKLKLEGTEFVVDGVLQDSLYISEYDVSFDRNELVLYNSKTHNKYYCSKNIMRD
jgi:energy-coupling factor transporter transmembrane protein EcfT